jgi:hypothetical protein
MDPIGFAGGDVNLYGYVQNNPVNLIDPLGLTPDCCGEWVGRAFRNFLTSCRCEWFCSGPEIWSSRGKLPLDTTKGVVINANGDVESGDACLCKDPDGVGHVVDLPSH